MYSIHITVDTNDGDYVTEISDISEDDLNLIRPLILAIKNCKEEFNYPCSDCVDGSPEELYSEYEFPKKIFETFRECCPYCEYGFHTIESIKLYPKVTMIEKLL